ncbi:hypothetical protein [Sporosarcina koreensis]|uniref:Uncharacterized protein n=1 Tax=Sporosarcina koreensis TaxID=334735 RepID=A0ABW0TTE1_9BACL
MQEKEFVTHRNPESKYEGLITYGQRDILLPEDALNRKLFMISCFFISMISYLC